MFAAPVAKKATPPTRKPASTPQESLTLPFEEPLRKGGAPETPAAPSEPLPPPPATAAAPAAVHDEDDDEDEGFKLEAPDDTYTLEPEQEAELEPEPVLATPRPATPKRTPSKRMPPITARRSRDTERGKFRAIVLFLFLCVMGYGALTSALIGNPEMSDRFVRGLPFVRSALGGDRLMSRKIALSDVAGSYQRIKDGKEVFVITGKAMNTAPVKLQSVQILGKLFDNAGQMLHQKVIYCGNTISAKVLRDLTPRELTILQQLNPPKHFVIEPGEASTFVIVFMDAPKGAVEYSAQVVGAQRQS